MFQVIYYDKYSSMNTEIKYFNSNSALEALVDFHEGDLEDEDFDYFTKTIKQVNEMLHVVDGEEMLFMIIQLPKHS